MNTKLFFTMFLVAIFTLHGMEQDPKKFPRTSPKKAMVKIKPLPGTHREGAPVGSLDYHTEEDAKDLHSPRDLDPEKENPTPRTKSSLVIDSQELFSANSLIDKETQGNSAASEPQEQQPAKCATWKRVCYLFCCTYDETDLSLLRGYDTLSDN